jgi:uncharacterized protein YbjT (DUF2867 family)
VPLNDPRAVAYNLQAISVRETVKDKIVVIVGATGAQGGGLARAVLADPASGFSVRAVTRRPESGPACALAARGADIVAADLDRVETLKRAFEGVDAAFCVTNFWEHHSPERELAHAAAMAQAAKDAGVAHVIWSTLEDARLWVPLESGQMPTLMGHYKVPHFDAKGEANAEFTSRNVPVTFLLTSYYWDNFINFPGMGLTRGSDGILTLRLPMGDKKLPGIAAEDIGRCAYGILQKGSRYVGKTVGIAGEHLTGAQLASALSRAIGQPVRYTDVSPEIYRTFAFPGAQDLSNMFQFKRDFEDAFCEARSVELSRQLNPSLQTFDQWLATHKTQISID